MKHNRRYFFAQGNVAEAIYLSIVYEEDIPENLRWAVLRMQLFDKGHSLEELDTLSFEDIGYIVGYYSGKNLGEEKVAKRGKKNTQQSG